MPFPQTYIDSLYESFSDVPRPRKIDGCRCCISDQQVHELLTTPLKEITPEQLSPYASSAFLTVGDLPDYLYFLPRILEISLSNSWWPDIEVTGKALSQANLSEWSKRHRKSVESLFDHYMTYIIKYCSDDIYTIDSWLCGLSKAGLSIFKYLKEIEKNEPLVIEIVGHNTLQLFEAKLNNPFWENGDFGIEEYLDWMTTGHVAEILARELNIYFPPKVTCKKSL